mgnify:CR=1 FL=1
MTAQLIPAFVDGRLTPVEKLAVHQRGLRHPAISVFVLRGDAVLMQRRALAKYHTPGLWTNTVCTHPHWGEDAHSAATRRVGQACRHWRSQRPRDYCLHKPHQYLCKQALAQPPFPLPLFGQIPVLVRAFWAWGGD